MKYRNQLLASTLLASLAAAAPAVAQSTPPTEVQNPDSQTGAPQSTDAQGRPAETEPQRGSATTETGTIIVTGSRVARPNATSASPITTVGQEEIKEFGATRVEDLTNSLPQVFAGQTSGVSNGADGTATIDLRGLGPRRTLVLIDGKRLQSGGINGGAGADLNFIPDALVSSVDLLTGGASSTYGADAVAGVVNFKMNRNFRGVRLDATYGVYQHNNNNDYIDNFVRARGLTPVNGNTVLGSRYAATAIIGTGTSDDKGSIVAYAGYRSDAAITQDQYNYSQCTFNPGGTVDANDNFNGLACGGSGTPAVARFGVPAANATLAGLPAAGSYTFGPTGALRPFVSARDAYNFAPTNYFQRPSERYQAGVFASYEISPAFQPYVDAMFSDYNTSAQIAPSGVFYGSRQTNCDNPLLLANPQLATAICGAAVGTTTNATFLLGKRNVEGGPRRDNIVITQYRIVTGVKGDINSAVNYDASYAIGLVRYSEDYENDVSNSLINNALNVRNVGGVPTCVVGATTTPLTGCVPYNIFTAGGVTPAAANYITIPLVLNGNQREEIANLTVQANLGQYGFQSPFAKDGLRVAGGVEYRTESLDVRPDQNFVTNQGAGQGGPRLPINGRYSVRDFFVEAGLPFVTDAAFFNDLSIQLGYRNSAYSIPGAIRQNKTNTYKVALNWSPVEAITFRGSYNRAVRSPNIGELFAANQVGLFSGTDPCSGPAVNGLVNGSETGPTGPGPGTFTLAQCARTGVNAATFGNITTNTAQQYNEITGGNINLRPEIADTYSAGVVLKPRVFGGNLVLSADYFNIRLRQAIQAVGSQLTLSQCLATGDPTFCSLINRGPDSAGPAAGTLFLTQSGNPIGFVNNFTINTGGIRTRGIDVNSDYRANIGSLRLRWQFVGTYLKNYQFTPYSGGGNYDCAGLYGQTCGAPNPRYRFNTNVKISTRDDFGLTVRWRYLSAVTVDSLSDNPLLNGGNGPFTATNNDNRIKAYNYFDLLFSVPISQKALLRVGVNNIFDKDPPIISQGSLAGTVGNGNTFPGTYDALGRYIFTNLTFDF